MDSNNSSENKNKINNKEKIKTVAVIGGGPIGCYTAYLFSQQGYSVQVYENHPRVGAPVQCTGILTSEFEQLGFPMDSFLVNTINKITVASPETEIEIQQKDYIVCRDKFDNFFADLAKSAGVKIFVNHSFTGIEKVEDNDSSNENKKRGGKVLLIKDSVNKQVKKITPYIVVGADGPLSPTAKAYGFYHKARKNYYGIQATVKGQFAENTIKTYFGDSVCPGLFAWVTPESTTTARVGLATTKNTKHYFDKFMQENNFKATAMQAGTIPIYNPKQKLNKDNCYLVGDASGYVKATTLGGLVPGLQQARILVDCVVNNKNYSKELRPLARQMKTHWRVHKVFNKFKDKDWNKLVSYVSQPKIKKVFEKYTRDNPIPLVGFSVLKEPRFLLFLRYLI